MNRYLDKLRYRRDKAVAQGDHAAFLMLDARIADELARSGAEVSGVAPTPPQPVGRTALPAAGLARS